MGKPDTLNEDVFFLRSELPAELSGAQRKEEVERRRVEFEVRTQAEGKLRASGLALLGDDEIPPDAGAAGDDDRDKREAPPPAPLDEDVLNKMADFLVRHGGGCDYGKFSSVFLKVKKKQLQEHFEVVTVGGKQRIELPE